LTTYTSLLNLLFCRCRSGWTFSNGNATSLLFCTTLFIIISFGSNCFVSCFTFSCWLSCSNTTTVCYF
ncbi:MAG: hypothetical protein ACOVPB_12140, partial [Bacteroidia bacterium]